MFAADLAGRAVGILAIRALTQLPPGSLAISECLLQRIFLAVSLLVCFRLSN